MVPPAIIAFTKRVPPGGDVICGKAVPGGTEIMHNMCETLRDKEVFGEDADIFRPERFLECNEEKKSQLLRVMALAFGHGRWMCPGKNLAWIQLNKVFVEVSSSLSSNPNGLKILPTFLWLEFNRILGLMLIIFLSRLAPKEIRPPDCEPREPLAM